MVKNASWCSNVYNQYTVLVDNRENVINKLKDQGIETGVMWPAGCHAQPVYNSKDDLKNTNYIANKILSLPCWPYMTDNEVAYVVENVNKII